MAEHDRSAELKAENARLIALLEANGIQWRAPPEPPVSPASTPEPSRLSTSEKVALFRRFFRGRTDVYPIRWESKTTAKSGYSPACANEWRAGVCEKPRIKCGDCSNRMLSPLSDSVIFDHLAGEHTVGVYPPSGGRHLIDKSKKGRGRGLSNRAAGRTTFSVSLVRSCRDEPEFFALANGAKADDVQINARG